MKPLSAIIGFLLLANLCMGQGDTYQFLPKWKVGDKRHLSIKVLKEEINNGESGEEEVEEMEADVEVSKEDQGYYYVNINYDNIVFTSVKKLYEKLGEEAEPYKRLNLKYKVNKQTGDFVLTNWKEAQDFLFTSMDQMSKLVKKKAPEVASLTNLVFDPIKNMLKDKATIENYFTSEMSYLAAPFGKKLSIGDTISVTKMAPNPFMPNDSIEGTTLTFLKNVDKEKGIAEIGSKDVMDLGVFKQMMKDMISKMAKSMGASEEDSKLKELDSINFDMDMSSTIIFDTKTNWPTKYTQIVIIKAEDGKKNRSSTVTKTVKLN